MMFEGYVFDYLIYLVAKGYAQETVRWRKSPLAIFGRYLAGHGMTEPAQVSRALMNEYLFTLKSGALSSREKALSDGTYRDHLIALNDFFRWLIVRQKLLVNPMADAAQAEGEPPVPLVKAITAEEMIKIIQSSTPTTALGLRDRAILELLYSTGIRRRELVNLNVGDFRVESHELLVVNGKGGKDRVVPVGKWACYFTEAYVKNVRPWQVSDPAEKALFVLNTNGRRLSPRAVGDIVDRATARSGVGRRVSPHTFRHSMATHMLRNHADLRHIQAILGHTSLRSTQIYTHTDIEDLKDVIKRSHPHGKRGRLQAAANGSKIATQETGDISE
jgi:integrase/recombinase XerD